MAEEIDGATVLTGDALELHSATTDPGEDDKRDKLQKALEEAIVATGLESMSISGEEEKKQEKQDEFHEGDSQSQYKNDKKAEEEGVPTVENVQLPSGAVPKTKWLDVTECFIQAAESLAPGELIQEAHFSLFDAMSAIELMDTKMDASLQWNTFQQYPRTLNEAVKKGILKLDGHTPTELIGIIDEVFACVATWLEGHTLAQTVFTCLYLLDTAEIENICLRAFSHAIVKIVEYMRECICRGGVYAEDDQQGICIGLNMLNNVTDTSVATSLKEAEEKVMTLLKHAASTDRIDAEVPLTSGTEAIKALLVRIKFTRNLFAFISALGKGTAQGIEASLQKLTHCLGLIDDISATIDLGVKVDPRNPLPLGFHPVINQRLLPPSYKPYGILPRAKGINILQTVLSQLQKVLSFGKLDSFTELFEAIMGFCAVMESPNVLVRSLLVLLCLQSDRNKLFGSPTMEVMLREDARVLSNPASINVRSPLSTSSQGKEAADRFFGRAVAPMMEFLRVYCQHRARQRQKIGRCLDTLGEFQQEAERIDHHLNELTSKLDPQRQHLACFGTWLLYYIVHLMAEYILLGFEYRLYSPFELHYVFWYLEYVYGWHYTAMRSAEKLLLSEPLAPGKGKRKAKKRRELPKEKEREVTIIQAKRVVCVGIMRALEALILDNKIRQPTFEFGSYELCYKHRFLPFASVATPQVLSYADYVRLAGVENYQGRHVNLYDASARHFLQARSTLESIPHLTVELESLLKVVKTNIVVMNLAAKGHKKDSRLPPTFDFSLHKHFPVIRIN